MRVENQVNLKEQCSLRHGWGHWNLDVKIKGRRKKKERREEKRREEKRREESQ